MPPETISLKQKTDNKGRRAGNRGCAGDYTAVVVQKCVQQLMTMLTVLKYAHKMWRSSKRYKAGTAQAAKCRAEPHES